MTLTILPPKPPGVEIIAAPPSSPPFVPDALVAEEDTFLVLSAEPEIREAELPRLRVFHEAFTARPAEPGTVIVREGRPVRLLAVVHDLSVVPTWREEWVASALAGVLREAGARGWRTLATPPLGRVHGSLPVETFLVVLRAALERCASEQLRGLWLVTPEEDLPQVRALLASGLIR